MPRRARNALPWVIGMALLVLAGLVFAVPGIAASESQPAGREIVRPWQVTRGSELVWTTIERISRYALPVPLVKAGVRRLALGKLSAGMLLVHMGSPSKASGRADAILRLRSGNDGVADAECRLSWGRGKRAWQACRLDVTADDESHTLEIEIEPGSRPRENWFVSSPMLVRADNRQRHPVFVFVLDTLRADSLLTTEATVGVGVGAGGGAGGSGSEPSGLGRLVRDGIVFENARAPSSWTRTSVSSLLTGLAPQEHGVHERLDRLSASLVTLPEVFSENGYGALAWSGNPNILPLWGFDQGLDAFADMSAAKPDATQVLRQVEQTLEHNADAPFFYYIHLMDPHGGYLPRRHELQRLRSRPDLAARIEGKSGGYERYLAEILGMEERIGLFLDFLIERGLYDQSLILIVSDHGEEFGEHGGSGHGATLFEEVLRVPILLKRPSARDAGKRFKEPIELSDMMAIVLDGVGLVSAPVARESDLSFASLRIDGHVLDAIKADDWKLVIDRQGGEQLFHLSSDPEERVDLTRSLEDEHMERAKALRGVLDARRRAHAQGWHIRGCPGSEPSLLTFHLEGTDVPVHGLHFEADDRLEGPDGKVGSHEIAMRVSHDLVARARDQTDALEEQSAWHFMRPSHDEVTFAGTKTSARLLATGDDLLRVRLGLREAHRQVSELDLSTARSQATVRDATFVRCTRFEPGSATEAYLHVWYVPESERVEEATIDPEIVEQLRALGYEW